MIVDSHQHFWQVGRFDYPWMTPELGVLCRDYLPPALRPILERNGVSRTVLVQASNSIDETRWLLRLADENPFIAGVVGWVDLQGDDVGDQLQELTAHAKFKGVRHLSESEPADDWIAQPRVIHGLRELASRGLAYDLLVHTRHLKYARTAVNECRDLRFVIDHAAKPPVARAEIDEWARELKSLAGAANVWCKLSGLVTEANWSNWRVEDFVPYVDKVLEYFGPQRMMFGSDWPVCLLAASYEQVIETFQTLLAELNDDDRELIFSRNALGFYRIEEEIESVPGAVATGS
ncbi:MAG TPA: amidohydrolase family protein [Pyrinomonadaceae bacterium]|nr:amidohydrolase family protein [Pyrinomonadaceae bacterium]